MSWHRAEVGRILLELHVQPGAAHTQVAGLHGERLKIRLAARAVDGRANEELIRFLAETFGVARRDVTIEAGLRSRRKRVAVSGAAVDAAALLASA